MDALSSVDEINRDRRRFVGGAAMAISAVQLGMIDAAAAQVKVPAIKPGTSTSFASLKQIGAGVLNVGYAEAGSANGEPVILLHGWPYDIHTYVDVAPLLASAGYRVIVPYLRGYGTTRFLSAEASRNGQPSAIAARHSSYPPGNRATRDSVSVPPSSTTHSSVHTASSSRRS